MNNIKNLQSGFLIGAFTFAAGFPLAILGLEAFGLLTEEPDLLNTFANLPTLLTDTNYYLATAKFGLVGGAIGLVYELIKKAIHKTFRL